MDFFLQAYTICKGLGDQENMIVCLYGMGLIYENTIQYQKALEFFQQAYTVAKELDDRYTIAINLSKMGPIYYNFGDFTKSLEMFQSALDIYSNLSDSEGMKMCHDWLHLIQDTISKTTNS